MKQWSDVELVEALERDARGPEPESLAEARAGLRLARSDSGVPDPGPAFWASFEAGVQRGLAPRRRSAGRVAGLAAAAALLAAVSALLPTPEAATPEAPSESETRLLDDGGWLVLAGLGDEVEALAPVAECPVEECLLELDERESGVMAGLLRAELAGRES